MILDLLISSNHIVLPSNFSVRLSFKFPLPYLDNIPAATTYWFTIPAVDENNKFFKHANFVYGVDKLKIYDCILVVAGNHMKGKLYLKNAKFREYKCFIVFNDIIEEISENKIADIVDDIHYLGDDTDAIIAEAKNLSQQSYPDSNYAFPVIYNSLYYSDKNQNYLDYGNRINQYNYITDEFVKNYYHNGSVHNVNPLIPMPYLFHIISEIFKTIRFSLKGNITEDNDFRKLVIFNNVALERSNATNYLHAKEPAEIAAIESSGLYSMQVYYSQIISDSDNTYNSIEGSYNSDIAGDYHISFKCEAKLPFYPGQYVELRMFDGTIMVTIGSVQLIADSDWHEIVIERVRGMNTPLSATFHIVVSSSNQVYYIKNAEIEIYPAAEYNIDKFSKQIELKDHVPDLTVSNFLNSLIKKFTWAVFFSFENMQIEIESWANIINNKNYLDLSEYFIKESENISFEGKQFSFKTDWKNDELTEDNFKSITGYENIVETSGIPFPYPSSVNQLLFARPANHFYIAVNDDSGQLTWQFLTDNFRDIITEGKDVEDIKTEINTIFSRYHSEGQLPELLQIGTITETGTNPFGFKLLNYHGLDLYPFSSNNKYDREGNQVSGVNLQMQGDDGVHDIYAKVFYDYISSRDLIEMDFKINAAIFNKIANLFKAGNKVRKVRVGAANYIPETVDITISRNSIDNCKIKLR